MCLWFENIYCHNNLRERSQKKQFIGPLEASHIERGILRRIEKTNVKRSYVINDLVKDVDTKGLVSHWPWKYLKFSWDK